MSIYSTWLLFEHPDQIADQLAKHGIRYAVIGDDTEDRETGSPHTTPDGRRDPNEDTP